MQRPVPFMLTAMMLVLIVVAGAANSVLADESVHEPKVLRVWWAYDWIDDLEPQTNEQGISDLTFLNYEGLTRLNEEQNVVPGAAEAWEFNATGTTIIFRLRDTLTYSDGSPLTAERFRAAIERRCDPHLTMWGADALFIIAGCEALHAMLLAEDGAPSDPVAYEAAKANLGVRARDDRTLEIDLVEPAPYFPALAGWIGFIPVRTDLLPEGNSGSDPWHDPAVWLGNGPFQVTAIEPEANPPRIVFARNERYWGGPAKLDGIEYLFLDQQEATEMYERGEIDVGGPPYDLIPAVEADPVLGRELAALPTTISNVYLFNLRREPFQDQKVREAFSLAFDRESYCRTIDFTCRPLLSWMPEGVPGSITPQGPGFDPARARMALSESGYGGAENLPPITWYYSNDDPWEAEQAAWMASQFHLVLGVDLHLMAVEPDEFDAMFDDSERWPQIADTHWYADSADPHEWLQFWTCGYEVFAEDIGYCNPAYDALVAASDREMDPEKRIALAEESQRVLQADVPAIFGLTHDSFFLVKPYVTGYSQTAPNQSWPGMATPLTVDLQRPA